jgi:hypothetical protein
VKYPWLSQVSKGEPPQCLHIHEMPRLDLGMTLGGVTIIILRGVFVCWTFQNFYTVYFQKIYTLGFISIKISIF